MRARLVAAARRRFLKAGYDVPVESILADAGASKGALYHHFQSKQDLFAAVFEEVARETIAAAVVRPPARSTPADRLKSALFAWLIASEESGRAAILYDLGPKALGWAEARAIEDRLSAPMMRAAIDACDRARAAQTRNPALTARLINAALAEIAVERRATGGRSPNDREAKAALSAIVDALLRLD
jgi:AcrR family transcriptional regulator